MRIIIEGGGPLDGMERVFENFTEWPILFQVQGMDAAVYPGSVHVFIKNTMPFPETNGTVITYARHGDDPKGRWIYSLLQNPKGSNAK